MLLAEDNPINQEVAVGLLETLDCAVTVVENGRQAVDAAKDGGFDIVLMDCQMPIMDGLAATRAIREAANDDQRLPIIALTADDADGTRTACIAAGMDDLLGKPFSRDAMRALLHRWQGSADGGQPTSTTTISEVPPASLDPVPIDALRSIDPDGAKGLLQRAITKFIDYSEGLVSGLEQAVGSDDVAEVARITHSLKSSSANLGATELSQLCADIERLTNDGAMPGDIDRRLVGLKASHRAATRALLALADA